MSDERELIRALRPLIVRHRKVLVAMLGVGLLAALSESVGLALFLPLFYSLEGTSADGPLGALAQAWSLPVLAAAILGAIALKNALLFANGLLYSRAYEVAGHDLRSRIVARWLAAPLAEVERRVEGDLLDTLKTQTWIALRALVDGVTLVIHLISLAVFAALLLIISWPLTVLVAVVLPLTVVLVQRVTRRVRSLSDEGVAAHERLSTRMLDLVRGMRTIRLFGRETDELARFDAASRRLGRVHFRRDVRGHLVQPLTETLVAALLVAVLLLTARFAMDLATVLTFLVVLYRMYPHLKHANHLRFALRDALAPVRASMAAAGPEPVAVAKPDAVPPSFEREIAFEAVSFRYAEDGADVLRQATFSIPAGRTTALVGPSGAGKSTVLHLLLRLFEPTAGAIRVDDTPLDRLDASAWRRQVAVVSQDLYLFHGTVRDNLAYGRPDATDAEVEAAARQAAAHDFIRELPDGYATVLGDGGLRLSGGQRQRLALARAFVRRPALYVLDEATNALDALSEAAVRAAIEAIPQPRTILVVTHDLSAVRDADHVVVLDGGRVVEDGSYAALASGSGLFNRLATA